MSILNNDLKQEVENQRHELELLQNPKYITLSPLIPERYKTSYHCPDFRVAYRPQRPNTYIEDIDGNHSMLSRISAASNRKISISTIDHKQRTPNHYDHLPSLESSPTTPKRSSYSPASPSLSKDYSSIHKASYSRSGGYSNTSPRSQYSLSGDITGTPQATAHTSLTSYHNRSIGSVTQAHTHGCKDAERAKFHNFCLNSPNDEWFEKEGLFYTKPQDEYSSGQLSAIISSPLSINSVYLSAANNKVSEPSNKVSNVMSTVGFLASTPTASSKARTGAATQHFMGKEIGHSCPRKSSLNLSKCSYTPTVSPSSLETPIRKEKQRESKSRYVKSTASHPPALEPNEIQRKARKKTNSCRIAIYKLENTDNNERGISTSSDMPRTAVIDSKVDIISKGQNIGKDNGKQENEDSKDKCTLLKKYDIKDYNINESLSPIVKISKKRSKKKESETELLFADNSDKDTNTCCDEADKDLGCDSEGIYGPLLNTVNDQRIPEDNSLSEVSMDMIGISDIDEIDKKKGKGSTTDNMDMDEGNSELSSLSNSSLLKMGSDEDLQRA